MIKKRYKIFLAVALFVIAVGVANALYRGVSTDGVASALLDKTSVIESLQTLEFKDETLDEERSAVLFERFQKARDNLNAAFTQLEGAAEGSEPLLYWPLITLGNVNREVGDFAKAEKAYLYAHAVSPDAFIPLGNLGELYFRYTHDYEQAEEWFLKVVEIDNPNIETYYSELHELYRFHLNNEKRAEQILIEGADKYSGATDLLGVLARYYRDRGRIDDAISTYRELQARYPESVVAKQGLEELLPS